MIQQTLCLIKPDATQRNLIGKILSHLEEAGLTIKALKKGFTVAVREIPNCDEDGKGI